MAQKNFQIPDVNRDWEEVYANKSTPWDVNQPEDELVNLVKSKLIQPCKVLELGCGHGNDSIFLAKNGFKVTAIDISKKAIAEAKRRAKIAGVKIRFLVEDASRLDLVKETFQFIYDRACFHFIPEEKRNGYLTNIKRLLKKDGYFVLIVSSDQERARGPYQFSTENIRQIFGDEFKIIEIRLITLQQHEETPTPYLCLMKKK
ncbi:MAG TPA: class I SAM-dependent methyltransferase [Candidatus Nanoarchaeia archaeon]|nr:class I SAM-dependent methyltransferase [Candidatus Nanoarchaeia archaeon]